MPSVLPLAPIRNLLARDCPFHICDDAVREIRDFLDIIAIAICKESVKKFTGYNNNREIQGLDLKKRLDAHAVESSIPVVANNLYKGFSHNNMGLESEEVIVNPGGTKMSMDNSTATPDKSTNDPREVV